MTFGVWCFTTSGIALSVTSFPKSYSVIAGARIDLFDALDRLEQRNPELVAPFVLRDLSDLEYHEIAEQLGLPLSTIKFRIQEARRYLQHQLGDSRHL